MTFNPENLLIDLRKLENAYLRAKSKSAKRKVAIDIFSFEELYFLYYPNARLPIWHDDIELLEIYEEEIIKKEFAFFENFFKERKFINKSSKNVLHQFELSHFNYYGEVKGRGPTFSFEEIATLISDFLLSLNNKYLVMFNNILDKKIIINRTPNSEDISYDGYIALVDSINRFYIVSYNDQYSFGFLLTLIHELGHAFEYLTINEPFFEANKTIYLEVSSMFFEYMFINYLIDHHLFLAKAVDEMKWFLVTLQNQIMINFLGSRATIQPGQFSKLINVCNENLDINNNSLINSDKSPEITIAISLDDLNNSLIYGYGSLLSIHLYERLLDGRSSFFRNFDNFLCEYRIIQGISSLEQVGITKQDLYENRPLQRILKKYK